MRELGKLRYALIGCGAAGRVHAYHFSRHPGVDCVAVVDPDSESLDFFQLHFGFRHGLSDYRELFDNETIDFVSIASPPAFHWLQIEGAVERGLSVLCEKPVVTSRKQAAELKQALGDFRGVLGVMLPRRFYTNTISVKRVLDAGLLGEIREVCFDLKCYKDASYYQTWRGSKSMTSGGVLMSQAIHSIDQLIFLFGTPEAVSGEVRTTRPYIEVEDEAEGWIRFQNGVTVKVTATTNATDTLWRGITSICGTKGKIQLDSAHVACWDVPGTDPPSEEEQEEVPPMYKPTYYGPGHRKVIHAFLAAIQNGEHPVGGGLDSLLSFYTILAFYQSSQLKREVRIGRDGLIAEKDS